jgi:PhnB protein
MMTQINAYLTFDTNCAEAMTFYKNCLDAELVLNKVEGSAMEEHCPAAMKGMVMHASLTKGNITLMASDRMSPGELIRGNGMSLSLNCSSEEELRSYFNALSAGGKVIEPVKEQFWGALFGMFIDKFGVMWLLNYELQAK